MERKWEWKEPLSFNIGILVVGPHQVGLSTNVSNFEKDDPQNCTKQSGCKGEKTGTCHANRLKWFV
jgi:hypothetical protein